MYIKKLRRKCSVKGCRNTDTFAISRSREIGNTTIICKSCLEKALKAIEERKPVPELRVDPTKAPPLFSYATVPAEEPTPAPEPVEEVAPAVAEEAPATEAEGYVCPHCGKVCASALGLQKHIDAKHKEVE